jgi:hypothetical protein
MTIRFFASLEQLDRPWGPPSVLFSGSLVLYREKELPDGEINHLPPSSLQEKGEQSCTFTPIRLHGADRGTLPYRCFVLHVKQKLFKFNEHRLKKYAHIETIY